MAVTTGIKSSPVILTGLFKDRDSAERACQAVWERDYDLEDLNLVMSDETRRRHFSGQQAVQSDLGTKAAEFASTSNTLRDCGIPEDRLKRYESSIMEGGILMGVKPRSDGDARHLEQEWKSNQGEQVFL